MTARRRGAGGFTLLETIVALAILAAGILGLMELLSGSLRLSGGARDLSAAAVYASQRMEEAMRAPEPADGTESGPFGEKYRWILTTTLLPPEGDGTLQPVRYDLSVRWNDGVTERRYDIAATRWDRKGRRAGG